VPDDNEKVFIKQVFFGLYRYAEFINAFNTAIFKANPSSTNRNDSTLYGVFLYLLVFRFDELPFDELKKMIMSQDAVKMNVMLQFLYDANLLKAYVREEWCKIYDATYIDDFVIGGLQSNLLKMGDLLATISKKATGKISELVSTLGSGFTEREKKEKAFKPTEPKPFKITAPKIKAIPPPIMIPKIVKANPVPEEIFKLTYKEIEEQKKKRLEDIKEETKKKYAGPGRFEFETEKRPT